MLYHHHPGVQSYKTAFELTRNMPPEHQCMKLLQSFLEAVMNLQPVAISFCIARQERVSSAFRSCIPSIQLFIMSFSFQWDSWAGTINKYQNDVEADNQKNAQQPPPGGEMAGAGPSKRKCMSMREFLAFHLDPCQQ
jgi:hypothetical protein